MATMDDIARELGVAKSTVSKALSGADDVSEATRKLVLEKAVELGYSRIVRANTRQRLAVLIKNMAYENPEDFGYDIIIGFRKMAEPAGYAVDIVSMDMDIQRETPYDEFMLKGDYRGALVLGASLADPWMRDFASCRTPTVLYDNHVPGNPNVTQIGIDNNEGLRMAVAHLKSLGHTRIGYLGSMRGSYVYQQRYQAFFGALREYGLEERRTLAGNAYHASECLSKYLPRLLDQHCTAIICSDDMLASGVLEQVTKKGLRVPQDLSIIGFDDLPLCRLTTPPLTTIRQARSELGKSAYSALISQLGSVPISTLLMHAKLIVRESCGNAP